MFITVLNPRYWFPTIPQLLIMTQFTCVCPAIIKLQRIIITMRNSNTRCFRYATILCGLFIFYDSSLERINCPRSKLSAEIYIKLIHLSRIEWNDFIGNFCGKCDIFFNIRSKVERKCRVTRINWDHMDNRAERTDNSGKFWA